MLRILVFLGALLPNVVLAQMSDYGTVRLLKGWQLPDGSYQMALEFDLNPGWKTYWRAPGSGGLPPLLEWDGSQNIAGVAISWPTPEVFETSGVQSIGYKGGLVLPIRITPVVAGPVRVALNLQFGVCSDICIPAEAVFQTRLNGQVEEGKTAIQAALNDVPQSGRAAGLRDISCRIEPVDDRYEITANLRFARGFRNPVTVIEYDSADIWITETNSVTSGRTLTAAAGMSFYGSGPMFLNRDALRITVLEGNRAVEIQGCPG
ncbi:MAG: hypothetical protein JKY31_05305 [Rhodobacteraceae bacterium]|nr:hypothetical protein [Paracoccaceae bacterium]